MISCAAGRCLNFVTFSLKTEKEPYDELLEKAEWERNNPLSYENAHITFMNIFKVESNNHQGQMRKDQLDWAVWECSFLPSEVGASHSSNNDDQRHLPGS